MSRKKRELEEYQETMARLYPELKGANGINTMSITFQVTDACSLACSYCYQGHKGHKAMSFDTAKTFIDNLFDDKYKGYVSLEDKPFIILDFIGGEPFLQAKLIEDICDYFYDKAIELMHPWAEHSIVSVCTNGVHWFEPDVQHFLKRYKDNLSISVTIDGDKELHDSCRRFPDGRPSYDLAVAAAQDWINRGGRMGSKITIAPENLQYLNKAIEHFIGLGYRDINANTVFEEGWTIEHAREYYVRLKQVADYFYDNDLYDDIYLSLFVENLGKPKEEDDLKTWCGGVGNTMLAIDPDGNLYPCLRYMESSLGEDQPPLIIGNVWDGIGVSEEERQWIKCMSCVTRRTEMTDECFYCPIGEGCAECAAYNYQCFGTPDHHATFSCDMHKARCLANTYFWNKYYRKIDSPERIKVWCPEEWALEIIDKDEYEMLLDLAKED